MSLLLVELIFYSPPFVVGFVVVAIVLITVLSCPVPFVVVVVTTNERNALDRFHCSKTMRTTSNSSLATHISDAASEHESE